MKLTDCRKHLRKLNANGVKTETGRYNKNEDNTKVV